MTLGPDVGEGDNLDTHVVACTERYKRLDGTIVAMANRVEATEYGVAEIKSTLFKISLGIIATLFSVMIGAGLTIWSVS